MREVEDDGNFQYPDCGSGHWVPQTNGAIYPKDWFSSMHILKSKWQGWGKN